MVYHQLTEQDVLNANSYVPILAKTAFVEEVASKCFDKIRVGAKSPAVNMDMPYLYKENSQTKSRYLMFALVKLYLRKDVDPVKNEQFLMAADDYDRWAGGHVLNQLERLKKKGTAEVKDKVYDLLQDYRDLERRLNVEVYGLLNAMNDPVSRFALASSMQMTPEALEEQRKELEKVMETLRERAKEVGEKEEKGAAQ